MKRVSVFALVIILAGVSFWAGYKYAPGNGMNNNVNTVLEGAPANSRVIPMSIVSVEETASTSPTVTIEYPQFPGLPSELNETIAQAVTGQLAEFMAETKQNAAARATTETNIGSYTDTGVSLNTDQNASAVLPMSSYSFIASWQPAQINSKYISFIERFDEYTGGANENSTLQTFNYDIGNRRFITLDDLFGSVPDYLAKIASTSRKQLIAVLSTNSNGNAPTDMITAGTAPSPENFADFTFTDYLLTVYFPKYAVAPGSFGEQHVTIPIDDIRE
ncbi:DUF3298 domain-containing protein [Patescibacteria group bacterium]|nr:DUF3298 domain-containing protein [Patescibacteria group bacterium]MDE1946289.1 DUF3298 domain-containing protein [Patescibacteria group bacterium]MDE2010741.1 DUF3298 domain-containing protein [Patescibacteria group bacterium]MDE2232625.1 DUF3298 domain-containing protein [Patescibacteria group bacterium]